MKAWKAMYEEATRNSTFFMAKHSRNFTYKRKPTSHRRLCTRSLTNFHKNMKKISNSEGLGSFTAPFREQLCRWQSAPFSSYFFESYLILGSALSVQARGSLNILITRLIVVPQSYVRKAYGYWRAKCVC